MKKTRKSQKQFQILPVLNNLEESGIKPLFQFIFPEYGWGH